MNESWVAEIWLDQARSDIKKMRQAVEEHPEDELLPRVLVAMEINLLEMERGIPFEEDEEEP